MRAVLSSDAVTMRDPSGLKAADITAPSWPRRTAISLAVAASQMRAVLSYDAVTMRDPSGLKAAEYHDDGHGQRKVANSTAKQQRRARAVAVEALTASRGQSKIDARALAMPA